MKFMMLLIALLCAPGCMSGSDSLVESTGTIEATQVDIRSDKGVAGSAQLYRIVIRVVPVRLCALHLCPCKRSKNA